MGFLFALFYPNVGSVLAYVGSVAGFLIIYTFPVLVHLSQMRDKITKFGQLQDPELNVSIDHSNLVNDDFDDKFTKVDNKTGRPIALPT